MMEHFHSFQKWKETADIPAHDRSVESKAAVDSANIMTLFHDSTFLDVNFQGKQQRISVTEIKVMVKKLFDAIDTNHNGKIEKDELRAYFRQVADHNKVEFKEADFEQNWTNMIVENRSFILEADFYEFMI